MERVPVIATSHRAREGMEWEIGPSLWFYSLRMAHHVAFVPAHLAERVLRIKGVRRCRVKYQLSPSWSRQQSRCIRAARAITQRSNQPC